MEGLSFNTLEEAKKWLSSWIDSGNKTIRCTAKDMVFNLFDDIGYLLDHSVYLDELKRPYILFKETQDNGCQTCELYKEPAGVVETEAMTLQESVDMETVTLLDELEAINKDFDARPTRYASREVNGMDVIDLVEHWDLSFAEGNILKYLLRNKGEDISDLEKIIDYANRRIKQLNK